MNKTQPWQQLLTAYEKQSLPHALLFSGQEGLGKEALALKFANFLLCAKPHKQACGKCKTCKLFTANTHPDFMRIKPEGTSKVIKIDPIRNIIDFVNNKAQLSGYRVIIITPADSMNLYASNALLKTLEEPNDKVVFILVSSHATALPITIRSRCRKINFATSQDANFCTEKNYKMVLINFLDLMNRQLTPLTFAEKCAKLDFATVIKYLQYIIIDLMKNKPTTALPLVYDKLIELNKNLINNPNQQLALEDMAMVFNNVN